MILLDTNVISETMSAKPHPVAVTWLNEQPIDRLFLSTVTIAEITFGVSILPDGRRKAALAQGFIDILGRFEGRILPFDLRAAHRYGTLAAAARAAGTAFPVADG